MSDKVIVVVSDREDAKRGEVTIVDDPDKATNLVASLLEAGYDQSQISLFSGYQAQMQISSRPVVALMDDVPSHAAAVRSRTIGSPVDSEPAALEATAKEITPYMKDGVRFSASFKAA